MAVVGPVPRPSRRRVAGRGSCSRLFCSLVLLWVVTLAGRFTATRPEYRGSKRYKLVVSFQQTNKKKRKNYILFRLKLLVLEC